MSWRHDEDSQESSMIRDISDRHCPDSVRESAYRELERRGISKHEAQQQADRKHGDYWG
jgi:hypothetical protein